MAWECTAVPAFFKALNSLSPEQRVAAIEKFKLFEQNPFDPRLGWNGKPPHKINKLTARHGITVYAGHIAGDLVFTFAKVSATRVISLDIGTHDIYK